MTNIEAVYQDLTQRVNKNRINDNAALTKELFVTIFNRSQNKFVRWCLEKRNEDDRRFVQKLLIFDKNLKSLGKTNNHYDFELPENLFDFSSAYARATLGDCKNQKILLWEVKEEDINELCNDVHNKPSFKHRESFFTYSDNKLRIFTDDFSINSAYLNYYRKPVSVDMLGYQYSNGTVSKNIDTEWDGEILDRILDICVKEFNLGTDNLQRYQIDNSEIQTDF